jgi:hypothetical protein
MVAAHMHFTVNRYVEFECQSAKFFEIRMYLQRSAHKTTTKYEAYLIGDDKWENPIASCRELTFQQHVQICQIINV